MRRKEIKVAVRCRQEGGEPSQIPHLISPRSVLLFYAASLVTLSRARLLSAGCVLGSRVPGCGEGAPASWAPCRFEVPAPRWTCAAGPSASHGRRDCRAQGLLVQGQQLVSPECSPDGILSSVNVHWLHSPANLS